MAIAYSYRPSLGNRLTAIALSLAICAIIVLMLIRMGWLGPGGPKAGERLTAVTFHEQSSEKAQHKAAAAQQKARQQVVQPRPVPQVPPTPQPVMPLPFIQMSREQYAAADISKLGKKQEQAGNSGASGGSAAGPGEGPGGARLYNAEWYREPTDAEMVTYMPKRDVSGGWAMIACKTQEKFRVDDCQELGESPPGSGLARALRQAAWQFLVRPPRIDGKPQIGVWVRIRFDFTKARRSAPDDGPAPPPD